MDIKNFDELNKNKEKFNFEAKALLLVCALMMLAIFAILIAKINCIDYSLPAVSFVPTEPISGEINDIKKFASEQDFKDYLEVSEGMSGMYGGGSNMEISESLSISSDMMSKEVGGNFSALSAGGAPDRISSTNVQVIGIDEPDIVKTDGIEIYFSGTQRFYSIMRDVEAFSTNKKTIALYPMPQPETKIIKAFPPANLALDGKIDKQGDLLLDNNILVVFSNMGAGYYGSGQEINGYDVSSPKSPVKKWIIKLENNTSVITSRLRDGKIYLITRNTINTPRPCPIMPLSIDGVGLNIKCADIYHPIVPVPVDSTFVAMALDPSTGKIEETVSFVGSSGSSTVYVSENAIYLAYIYNESIAKFFSGFVKENDDLFPSSISEKVIKLEGYDISENTKMIEIVMLLEKYSSSLDGDEKLKVENEMENRMGSYYQAHRRDLEKTSIVKIDLNKFQVTATGTVPGHLLNNFAMDEYKGNLRVASTIGSRWGIFGNIGSGESVSDVTILNKNLNFVGSVKDLGKTEQIYSVRFIEDRGYVVTFRQIDPFYILDLANPASPKMTGELKIPGYSSYLHPLDASHVLGIGMEGSKVKISLFDVSDKNNPVEIDKYMLDEYWTEVSNNYHAFLLDTKHNIFFLPGSKGGYIFSYFNPEQSNPDLIYKLKLKKAISQNSVKRAIYLSDYLYIIGEDKITVLNELDWEKVNELDLQ